MSKGKTIKTTGNILVSVIGDEVYYIIKATVTGLLLTGLGERTKKGQKNFFIVDKETTKKEIETAFTSLTQRTDIGIILINQHVYYKTDCK